MENYVNSIKTIEELSAQILNVQSEIKTIDTEAAALSAVEGSNTLTKQRERLSTLEVAVIALSTANAKQLVEGEIASIKTSIKNLERLDELAEMRGKTLVKLNKLSTDFTTVIGTYKGYRMNFEKSFSKISKDTIKLLSNEEIPEVVVEDDCTVMPVKEDEKVEEELIFATEKEGNEAPVEAEEIVEEVKVVDEVVNEIKEEIPMEEITYSNPILSLARVLRSYEELTDQQNAEKYSSRYSGIFKEMMVPEEEKASIMKIMDGQVEGLTAEQTKIIKLSMPKEIIGSQLKRTDVITERKNSTEVYALNFLNQFRPAFTYKVIAELGRLILADEPEQEKAMKIALFFKNNSDHMVKGRFGSPKPEYRAFMVLNESDLEG